LLSLQGPCGFRPFAWQGHASASQFREPRRSSTASRRWRAPPPHVRATVKEFGELEVTAPSGDLARQAPWTICTRLFAAVRRASRTLVLNRASVWGARRRILYTRRCVRARGLVDLELEALGQQTLCRPSSARGVAHEAMAALLQFLVQSSGSTTAARGVPSSSAALDGSGLCNPLRTRPAGLVIRVLCVSPRFCSALLSDPPHGDALAFDSSFGTIRLDRELPPPSYRSCPTHNAKAPDEPGPSIFIRGDQWWCL
jgi:hypothetical protein